MKSSLSEIMLLALLRMALWDEQPDLSYFEVATTDDWQQVIRLSGQQCVQAVAFDGVLRLPSTCQPPRPIKLTWAINVVNIEKRFDRYYRTAGHLADFYKQQGLRIMLMKGIGLADIYPVPIHRESVDFDIWLFGRYEQGNFIAEKQGMSVDRHNHKHSLFYFQGIPVENHQSFLNIKLFSIDRNILEPTLHRVLAAEECGNLSLADGASMLLPPPTFNAIFLARHMSTHFVSGVVLRHLCDWARFLYSYQGQYDAVALTVVLSRAGLLPVMKIFTELAIEQLGMPAACSPFVRGTVTDVTNVELKARVWQEILYPYTPTLPEGEGFWSIVVFKWKRLCRSQWKYRLVHRESFIRRIAVSTLIHILHPETIIKLK